MVVILGPNSEDDMRNRRGQMTVEYSVMFVAIVAAILVAASTFIKPSLNKFFASTSNIIDKTTETVQNNF
jgi:Flp pilus assembly pilin Flp